MYGEYVKQLIDLQFRRQVLVDYDRYVPQLAHQEFHNSKEILGRLATLIYETEVEYPIWNATELRFKLEPGVVIQVTKTSIPMVLDEDGGPAQPNLIPPTPPISGNPPAPPPATAPNDQKIELTAPYEGNDDNGNTYVRGGQTIKTKFWLSGTYLDGNNQYQQQSSEPSSPSAYILVSGRVEGTGLEETSSVGIGPDGQYVYGYKLSTGQQFNGGWKRTPGLQSRVITA